LQLPGIAVILLPDIPAGAGRNTEIEP